MFNFKEFYGMEHFIQAPNLSGGFHGVSFAQIKKYFKPDNHILLIAEQPKVFPTFKAHFPSATVFNIGFEGQHGEEYVLDLNKDHCFVNDFDIVFSQALLEHICNPFQAIKNMSKLCKNGGHIVIHTVNSQMPLHRYPIDCLRFFEDWFKDICNYLPIELVEYDEWGAHCFAVYKKLEAL